MGGAERAQRRRRQQLAAKSGRAGAVRAARGSGDRNQLITMVVVIAVIAVVVIGGVIWQNSRSKPLDAVPVQQISAEYPVAVEDKGIVVAGKDDAKLTVDIYEDFLCPACAIFEERDSKKIEEALAAGTVKVRYHLLNLLDAQSNPPGYSLESAAAGICAAEAGEYPTFHASLYSAQPREGGAGYSVDQLVQLGKDAGITSSDFESCVRSGTHKDAVRATFDRARNDPALKRPGASGQPVFGTPTVVADGKVINLDNENWLAEAIAAAG